MKSPLVLRLLCALLKDFNRVQANVKGLERDYITLKARFEHEGIGFFSVALPSLCNSLDRGLAEGRFACPHGFRLIRGGALPRLFSGLLCEVFDTKTGSLKEAPDVGAVKCLREVLMLFKKFKSSDVREEELHRSAIRTFWHAEEHLAKSTQDSRRADLLSRVCGLVLSSLDSYEPREIRPRHGPGAVCEKVVGNQKWSLAYQSLREEAIDISHYALDIFACTERACELSVGADSYPRLPGEERTCSEERLGEPSLKRPLSDYARLISVPKNSVSRRLITVEPLMNQFIQQGLNVELRSAIERCSILRNCLALTDQTKNQQLALEGSRTGKWATIDLKSASDLLDLKLVKLVFGRHAAFLGDMLGCRSDLVSETSSSKLPVGKFAGMGNALTFPVQSVVFATLAITALLEAKGRSRPSPGSLRAIARRVRVYGDDIIVESKHATLVMEWIESFGLIVNRKKSFAVGNFRESCGVDAFKGYDVTPVYVRHDPQSSLDVEGIAACVSASNLLWLRGLYASATILSEHVENLLNRRLPIAPIESGALTWATRTGVCEYQKWDSKLQRLVFRAPVIVGKTVRDNLDGYPALLKAFLTPLIERGTGHLTRSVRRFSPRITWRWKPAVAGSYSTAM